MEKRLQQLPKLAEEAKKESLKYFANIKRRVPKNFDYVVQELHDAEFKKTDCLDCGNCCKTTSPIFTDKDTERISKYLRMKVADFEKQYLQRERSNPNYPQRSKSSSRLQAVLTFLIITLNAIWSSMRQGDQLK